ncbi:MAG TPA: hypothetical protein VNV63_00835 [Nitrospiria bacterium]|jgi:hypothetical protein|nr:hypothetical protein [Nitrospiria bacterium]
MSKIVVNKQSNRIRSNVKLARSLWGNFQPTVLTRLKEFTGKYGFSVAAGDLQLLDGRWYVTHAGLLGLSCRKKCLGIKATLQKALSDPVGNRWVFKAIVYTTPGSKGFVGYGDADPSNTSSLVRGCEMRVAETRAVNRALRKAYGIGLCSVEELGYLTSRPEPAPRNGTQSNHPNGNGSGNGQPRLRDRLCLLIRQHHLDPHLVKRYAADFCGTQEIREASRDLVESFITHLSEWAGRDRAALLCKLNSYSESKEVHS